MRDRVPAQMTGEGVGRAPQVVLDLLLDRALIPRLRPAALVVLTVHVVLEGGHLHQPLAGPAQQAGGAPVDQDDADVG